MSPNERFEVEAAVFYRMFGMVAPGKDDRSDKLRDHADRVQTWEAFRTVYGKSVGHTIDVVLGIQSTAREQVEHEAETMEWIRNG